MEPVFLDTDNNGHLVITQTRQDTPTSRIVLTQKQVDTLMDILMGPQRVLNAAFEIAQLVPPEKLN